MSEYTTIIAFGDSLLDNGNRYERTGKNWPPSPPYYHGRCTNGPVWPEYLSEALGAQLFDFAYAGATTNNSLAKGLVPSVADQVDSYLSMTVSGPTAAKRERSLHILSAGGSDIRRNPRVSGVCSARSLLNSMYKLQKGGARHFLFTSPPPLDQQPQVKFDPLSSPDRPRLVAFTTAFSQTLQDAVEKEGSTVRFYDQQRAFKTLKALGSVNTTGTCIRGEPPMLVADPENYYFWDDLHPTTRVHKLIAKQVQAVLKY